VIKWISEMIQCTDDRSRPWNTLGSLLPLTLSAAIGNIASCVLKIVTRTRPHEIYSAICAMKLRKSGA